jgi:hypothetical protein
MVQAVLLRMLREINTARLGRSVSSSTSLKCVHAMAFGEGDMAAKRRNVAHSRPTPSAVNVPLPNSSMIHSDLPQQNSYSLGYLLLMTASECLAVLHRSQVADSCWVGLSLQNIAAPGDVTNAGANRPVAARSIETIWLRSSMNCDCPTTVASWLARRVKMRSVSPTIACVYGCRDSTENLHRHHQIATGRVNCAQSCTVVQCIACNVLGDAFYVHAL